MKKKVLLVATVQSHICQFHRPLVEMLHEKGCVVHVCARNNLAEKNGLKLDFADKVFNINFQRSPFSIKNIKAYRELKKIIKKGKYDVVHCNTPVGGILTRLACKKLKDDKPYVIYEAHGFHFYKGAPLKNWLLYYPIEKYFAKYTDTLITITKEDYYLAKDKFKTNTVWVHGVGIRTKKYVPLSHEQKKVLKQKLGYKNEDKILLCVGELNENKNQTTIIKAMQGICKQYPNIKLLLAGNGPLREKLENLVKKLNLVNKVEFLGYRTGLGKFAHISDVIVSCSKREGLPMNIAEAMYLGKPVVVSSNRGHRELVINGKTGYIVKAEDINGFKNKILKLLRNKNLCESFGKIAKEKSALYTDKNIKQELEEVYFGK